MSLAEPGEAFDELDGLNPFDLLEAELKLVSQAERGTVQLVERRAVHFVGEDGQVVAHVLDLVSVVVQAAFGARTEGVEHGEARLGRWLHQVEDVSHRDAAPLGDACDTLLATLAPSAADDIAILMART